MGTVLYIFWYVSNWAFFKANKTNGGEISLKSVHGPSLKVFIGSKTDAKSVIDHKTLFRIKTETNLSGRKIVRIF